MNLSPNFHLSEFEASEIADRFGYDNRATPGVVKELTRLCGMMEAVRVALGAKPISINSGYRSPRLNSAVGGAKNSAHIEGRACDFICPQYGTPLEICQRLSSSGIAFDKLIQEGRWVHIQIAKVGLEPRKQVLTAKFEKGVASYSEGLT
jgi:zinc D-Ala-D-Ala carboxypeptidase